MIELTSEFRKRSTALAVPRAFFDADRKAWVFDPTDDDRAAQIAMRLFPHVRDKLDLAQVHRIEGSQHLGRFDAASEWAFGQSVDEMLPRVPPALRALLYPYQSTDLGYLAARMRADGAGYLAWDRGLGKTLGAICLAYEHDCDRVLVVTPSLSKQSTWLPEFTKWDVESKWNGRIYDVGNNANARERAVKSWKQHGGVLLCHYEAARLIQPLLGSCRIDLTIVDEAHRLANGSASAKSPAFYKALKRIKSDKRLLLSGSVIINSPEDFFGGLHFMFPDVYRSKWRDWNDKYLSYVDGGFGKVLIGVRPDRLAEMREELAQFMCVRDKRDELPGLPDRIDVTRELPLRPEQSRVYVDLAEQYLATLPDGTPILLSSQLAQLTKLRQVAVGLELLDPDLRESNKFDYAEQLISDSGNRRYVVFCWHKAAVDTFVARLKARGIDAQGIHGDTKHRDRDAIIHGFRFGDGPQVLVATIATLGESITLSEQCSDMIFIESAWTSAAMDQSGDRIYRIGQKERVTITHIVSENTVDTSRVLPAVASKAELRRMILGGNNAATHEAAA